MQLLVIGLTGGLASGKSTAAKRFQSLGVPVIDADSLAREAVAPGEPAVAEIRQLFGPEAFHSTGELNRARLRQQVFADPGQRRQLEQILHPRIRNRILQALGQVKAPYAVLMIPLLVESKQDYPVNRILVVDAPRSEQIRRAASRDGSDIMTLNGILTAQASRAERLAQADDIINNTGSVEELQAQVDRLHHQYLKLAACTKPASVAPLADNSE